MGKSDSDDLPNMKKYGTIRFLGICSHSQNYGPNGNVADPVLSY